MTPSAPANLASGRKPTLNGTVSIPHRIIPPAVISRPGGSQIATAIPPFDSVTCP